MRLYVRCVDLACNVIKSEPVLYVYDLPGVDRMQIENAFSSCAPVFCVGLYACIN